MSRLRSSFTIYPSIKIKKHTFLSSLLQTTEKRPEVDANFSRFFFRLLAKGFFPYRCSYNAEKVSSDITPPPMPSKTLTCSAVTFFVSGSVTDEGEKVAAVINSSKDFACSTFVSGFVAGAGSGISAALSSSKDCSAWVRAEVSFVKK